MMRILKDLDVAGKTVLLRAGFDVGSTKAGLRDDLRIRNSLLTIDYLLEKRAKILIITHTGRPQGWDEEFSLKPVAARLAELLERKFIALAAKENFLPEYEIPHLYFFPHNLEEFDLRSLIAKMRSRDVAVLENLRFYSGEKKNDLEFAKKLAGLAEIYINEAFSNSHRDDASMTGLPKFIPAAAGLALEKEVQVLSGILWHPNKPLVVMIGGVKLADKAAALQNLAKIASEVLLGGAVANLFLKNLGLEIGKSISREKGEDLLAKDIWRNFKEKLKLPKDAIVARGLDEPAQAVPIDQVKPSEYILDIGPKTIQEFSKSIKTAKTLVWSGPLGHFEKKSFSHGTLALGRLFASRGRGRAVAVAGGGDTIAALNLTGLKHHVDHISTGGGAMLEFLAGRKLPALDSLER